MTTHSNMRRFSDHVIAVANGQIGGITNLQLQKVMYFALGNYISEHGIDDFATNIYDEKFEAWPYGPVIRSEYFRNRRFGRYFIGNQGQYNYNFQCLDGYIQEFMNKNVNNLVEESHEHGTWVSNRDAIFRHELIEYELEDLQNDFAA